MRSGLNMKIANKIILVSTALCALGVIFTGAIVGLKSAALSEQALITRASQQLVSVREIKKSEIESYFEQIHYQVETLADDIATKDAMKAFTQEFQTYPSQQIASQDVNALRNYYSNQFGQKYRELNEGAAANEISMLDQIGEVGKALQARYIAVNPNPLGEKHQYLSDTLGTTYDQIHAKYHPSIKHFLEAFGYYDIFFVDNEGNVVYSVFKELDFATNLKQGPYSNTGIAEAYRKAAAMSKGQYYLDDFKPYYPSYEAAASFIATPIMEGNSRLGVLIFQMPVDVINNIMTFKGNWAASGLGESGESYLIGPDKKMRSQSRFLLEAPDDYLAVMKSAGVSSQLLAQIASKGSTIGRQEIDSNAARNALMGRAGFEIINDYRGVQVMSAYSPVTVAGLKWAILTEIDYDEALMDLTQLEDSVRNTVLMSIVGIIVVSVLLSYVLGNSISRPIRLACEKVERICGNNDLTERLDVQGKDEVTELSASLNHLFSHLQQMIGQFSTATDTLSDNSLNITNNMQATRKAVAEQNTKTDSVATAVNEMSASIAEVAQFANRAADYVKGANEQGVKGVQVGNNLGEEIGKLHDEMQVAVEAIGRLRNESASIAEVLDVIQGIAEQTNLLALNAAIEAARAGEQGRGFAVVADEVRSLAGRTQSSTEEIRQKIDALQRETNSVSHCIDNANKTVSRGVSTCKTNTEMIEQLVSMLEEMNEMNIQIAAATEEQRAVTEDISSSITSIADASVSVNEKVTQVDDVSRQLADEAKGLSQEMSKFRF